MKYLGLVQGRLTPPDEGFQICPKDWQKEFQLLEVANLTHIEWIVTSDKNKNNPFYTDDISKFPISHVCLDNLVNTKISTRDFLNKELIPACSRLEQLGLTNITIPLLEKSSIEVDGIYDLFYKVFSEVIRDFRNINFCLETEVSLDKLTSLCDIAENVRVVYDTGNTTSYGLSHEDFVIKFSDRIESVHLKDRTYEGKSVEPGTGNTPFKEIFRLLKKSGYSKFYTMQTARCTYGDELDTISRHAKIFRELYDES